MAKNIDYSDWIHHSLWALDTYCECRQISKETLFKFVPIWPGQHFGHEFHMANCGLHVNRFLKKNSQQSIWVGRKTYTTRLSLLNAAKLNRVNKTPKKSIQTESHRSLNTSDDAQTTCLPIFRHPKPMRAGFSTNDEFGLHVFSIFRRYPYRTRHWIVDKTNAELLGCIYNILYQHGESQSTTGANEQLSRCGSNHLMHNDDATWHFAFGLIHARHAASIVHFGKPNEWHSITNELQFVLDFNGNFPLGKRNLLFQIQWKMEMKMKEFGPLLICLIRSLVNQTPSFWFYRWCVFLFAIHIANLWIVTLLGAWPICPSIFCITRAVWGSILSDVFLFLFNFKCKYETAHEVNGKIIDCG